jgi:hypothetical protein
MAEEINRDDFVTPFGRVLGVFEGVEGRSNGNDRYFSEEQNFVNGIYTGYKYQCVEYARRWVLSRGFEFVSVPFASHIWHVPFLERSTDKKPTLFRAVPNGSSTPPVADSIIIWKVAEEVPYGHIAVITDVSTEHGYVRIAEQNMENNYWPGNYARELKLELVDGGYWIRDEAEMYGWMVINFDADNQDPSELVNIEHPVQRSLIDKEGKLDGWLDDDDRLHPEHKAQLKEIYDSVQQVPCYTMEAHMSYKIQYIAMECSFHFIMSVNEVIGSDESLTKLGYPAWSWPFLRSSWGGFWGGDGKSFTGRLDFAFNGRNVKLMHNHLDSLSNIVESVYIHDKLFNRLKYDNCRSPSAENYSFLINQCKAVFKDFVHISILEDGSQEHLAVFMQKILREINIESKILRGNAFVKKENGTFEDLDGLTINQVWKKSQEPKTNRK